MGSAILIPKVILFFLFLIQVAVHGKFWHINVDIIGDSQISLSSTDVDCPTASEIEDCDVIWSFSHSIQIETVQFSLDGQRGDFILISDLPLLFGDSVGNDTELPNDYGDLIASDSLTLMSWESNATSIRVLTKHGAFIHYHKEKRNGNPPEGRDSSFRILIQNLDFLRLPSTTVPPETTVATEKPGVEVYLSKFLDCMTPEEFLSNKDKFKGVIADVATEYCESELNCLGFEGDILTSKDVNIPDDGGLHYCDPLWEVYKTCVEVTFAIVYTNGTSSRWLMSQVELEKIWDANDAALRAENFCPYDPPAPLKSLNGFVWIASTLGLLLLIMIVLCSAWIWNEPDTNGTDEDASEKSKKSKNSEEIQPMTTEVPPGGGAGMGGRFFDHDNPIMVVLEKMRKGADDSRYLERKTGSQSSGYNTTNENMPGINPVYGIGAPSKVTQNMLFQEQEVTFDFHNPTYQHDDEEVLEQEEHYGYGFPGREQQRSPNQFLSIEREFYDERSDTEI